MHKTTIILAQLTFCLILFSCGPNAKYQQNIDEFFEFLEKENLAMGSVTISKNGEIVYQNQIGYSVITDKFNAPVDSLTKFRIASITKLFTAILTIQLIEDNKLQFDTKIQEFYPEIPNSDIVSIRNLFNHTSGFSNVPDAKKFFNNLINKSNSQSFIDSLSRTLIRYQPDQMTSYSNFNYVLLTYIIEGIYNDNYGNILNKKICTVLDLKNTYYLAPIDIDNNESIGYKYTNYEWTRITGDSIDLCGDGGITSTPTDLVKMIEGLFNNKLLREQNVRKMISNDYGMGRFPFENNNRIAFGHDGYLEGYSSRLIYFPKDHLAIAYCSNGLVLSKDEIFEIIVNAYFNNTLEIPSFEISQIKNHDFEQFVGTYYSISPKIKLECMIQDSSLVLISNDIKIRIDPIGENKFINRQYGFFYDFDMKRNTLMIRGSDGDYLLRKE